MFYELMAQAQTGLSDLNLDLAGLDLKRLFNGLAKNIKQNIGPALLALVGTVAIIFAAVKTVTNLTSKQGPQTSWGTIVALFVVGGCCIAGAAIFFNLGEAASNTVNEYSK